MKKLLSIVSMFALALVTITTLTSEDAQATSQWSRKYKTNCITCHTAFPRLNYYGERFMRNGYQDPDGKLNDGGTLRKKTYGNVDVGNLGDYFGARVNISPIIHETKGLDVDGKQKAKTTLGKVGWIQFFTAGTITEDVSIFNEFEVHGQDADTHHGWFRMGFHNLGGTTAANIYVGKLSPSDFTAHSNRLRVYPEYKAKVDKVTTSAGAGEEPSTTTSGQYGVMYYGYKGPMVWALGAGNGSTSSSSTSNANEDFNMWGSLKFENTNQGSNMAGSSFSVLYFTGTDSANTAGAATAQTKNEFTRTQISGNLRFGEWDFIATYHMADEDNYTLATTKVPEKWNGTTIILSKFINNKHHLAVQRDTVEYDKAALDTTRGFEKIAAHYSYLPKENINLIWTAELEQKLKGDDKNDKFYMTIRSMF